MLFKHGNTGYIECQQLYSSGLLFHRFDVKRPDQELDKPVIYCSHILGGLATILLSARLFYREFGYQGVLKLGINLEIKDKNIYFYRLTNSNPFFFDSYLEALLPNYHWKYSLNTSELNDSNELLKLYCQIADDIHWSFGFKGVPTNVVETFLSNNHITF